jgi:phosphopantothenoylcysteine decarboxylase/phosphopantothenate--cysteine ligase
VAGDRSLGWLVTAGPTCEDVDPVRFVTNRSSGRMGYAVARAAAEFGTGRGDRITLVSGPVSLEPPPGCDLVRVRSARDMFDAVTSRFDSVDVVIMAAAVADFRPVSRSDAKIKKTGGGLVLRLEPTEDVLAELGRRKRDRELDRILIGFALEAPGGEVSGTGAFSPAMRGSAERKLADKNLDAICLNMPVAMGADRSELSVLRPGAAWDDWGEHTKDEHARRLVEFASVLAGSGDARLRAP